jgi:hypothetical protein
MPPELRLTELRQLNSWERIEDGDLFRYAQNSTWMRVGASKGLFVGDFYKACKQLGLEVLVVRPTKSILLSPQEQFNA